MKTFSSSKNLITVGVLWILVLFLTGTVLIPKKDTDYSIAIYYAIITPVIGCLIWVLCDTKYIVKDKLLHYYSGPFRGKIEIDKITKMNHNSGWILPVTMKPGLGTKGCIISYNKFDAIYISPQNIKEFEEILLRINPEIQITS